MLQSYEPIDADALNRELSRLEGIRFPEVPKPGPIEPPRFAGHEHSTLTVVKPVLTRVPGWPISLDLPTATTEKPLETTIPAEKTTDTVTIPTTVMITRTKPVVDWSTLPDPDQESTISLSTASATFSEPTTASSTTPVSTTAPEPTTTPTHKKKSQAWIYGAAFGSAAIVAVIILLYLCAWHRYKRYQDKRDSSPEPQPGNRFPFRDDLSPPPRQRSVSYFDTSSSDGRRRGRGGEWGEALREWMGTPRHNEDHRMEPISRPSNAYTSRPDRPASPVYPVHPVHPSPYSVSIYSQDGRGIRPDSGRPLGNWI